MKRFFIVGMALLFFCSGCGKAVDKPRHGEALEGAIGDEIPISRKLAAKMIALAFYSPEEINALPANADFPDVSQEDWAYPYINAAVDLNFFSGDGEGFRPKDDLCLWEAQVLMDRMAPDYDSRMVLTEENREMSVAYSLWTEVLERALMARRGEDSLYSYGFRAENQVLFEGGEENAFDGGRYGAEGYDLAEYTDREISFWQKDGEIVALLSVVSETPTLENIYCRQENGQAVLVGNGTEKSYPTAETHWQEGIADVTIAQGKATIVSGEKLPLSTVKRADGQEVYLADMGTMPWAEGYRIYGQDFTLLKAESLISGTAMADFYIRDGKVMGAVVQKEVYPENIRVLLGGGLQKSVSLNGEFTLSNSKNQKKFAKTAGAVLTADLPWFDFGIVTVGGEIRLKLGSGEERAYGGVIELERRGEEIAVVNELPLEEYLLGVVPYEMPVRFGQAALEAQAICARSYAYNQFYANAYGAFGAHLTDTVASQVFMGADTAPEAEKAVQATKGLCVVSDGKVAQTYFYSASCGFGTRDTDVWSRDGSFRGEGKSYLTGGSHGVAGEPKTEEEWLTFFQDWESEGYDKASPWYRWKVYFGAGQLTEIMGKTTAEVIASNSALVKIKQSDGSWKQGTPKGFGQLTGLKIAQRGTGGVVQTLELSFEKGAVQVSTEYALRKLLSPTKITVGEDIFLQRSSGGTLTGQKLLPSGYFAVKEMKNPEGTLTGIALYGGGCGHGVGMSQYGAKQLAANGKTGEEIIAHYFPGTTVEQVL